MKTTFTLSKLIPLVFILGVLFSLEGTAQQTKKISLQGFLKDADGKAIPNGRQDITFKLYSASTGGTAEWTEEQSINVIGGVYSTHLGSVANPVDGLNWGASTYYVGVTLQGVELTPRTELTFAPYSLGSPKAQEVVCSGAVGDIKHSILNPTQFAAVNGNCWVPMDGRNITGSKLATIMGTTTLPNGGGLFIRSQEFANSTNFDDNRDVNSPIASFQAESFASHGHSASLSISGGTNTDGFHSHVIALDLSDGSASADIKGLGGFYPANNNSRNTSSPMIAASDRNEGTTHEFDIGSNGSHSHSISGSATGNTNSTGGNETRPDNLNFWVYIRIN